MPVFEYRVRNRAQKELKSTMEAETINQVRDVLRAKDLTILEIKTQKTGLGADVSDLKIPFLQDQPPGLKQVSIFSKQFSTLINAGVPLVQSLSILQRQIEHKGFQSIVKNIRSDVESGTPLSEAIAKYPKVFNRLYINLVRAGETSGTLDLVLNRISGFQKKSWHLEVKLKVP